MAHDSFSLDEFQGTAKVFPLPNLVLFPHVVQPLHIFETRYIRLLEDALAGDQLLATALLLPGWEQQEHASPPIDPTVCISRVMSHAPTKDGRYNVLLGGIARARIVAELPSTSPYRTAEIEILRDIEPAKDNVELARLHTELVRCFRKLIPEGAPAQKQLDEILTQESQLGTLTDLISYSFPLDVTVRQNLLAEVDVLQRTRILLDKLSSSREDSSSLGRPFPPEFSLN